MKTLIQSYSKTSKPGWRLAVGCVATLISGLTSAANAADAPFEFKGLVMGETFSVVSNKLPLACAAATTPFKFVPVRATVPDQRFNGQDNKEYRKCRIMGPFTVGEQATSYADLDFFNDTLQSMSFELAVRRSPSETADEFSLRYENDLSIIALAIDKKYANVTVQKQIEPSSTTLPSIKWTVQGGAITLRQGKAGSSYTPIIFVGTPQSAAMSLKLIEADKKTVDALSESILKDRQLVKERRANLSSANL